jgi:hypothetical protein
MISKRHNYFLGECFSVDHKNKKIYFWHSTSVDLKDHPFKETVLSKVMNGLGMLDNKNESAKYKLVIVLCTDWSREIIHGSKFKIKKINKTIIEGTDEGTTIPKISYGSQEENNNKPEIDFEVYTLQEWKQFDKSGIAKKINTIIARVCYYPNLEHIVLQK